MGTGKWGRVHFSLEPSDSLNNFIELFNEFANPST